MGDDAIRGVFMSGGSSLIGFTVTNGYTMASGDGNFDRSGGGVWLATDCVASNLIVSGNSANTYGAGVYLRQGGTVNNCIVWDNTATGTGNDIFNNNGEAIRYTCASDGVTPGTNGNITADPLFVDGANSNFQLQVSSPCINAGNNTYAPTNATPYDLAGNPRIMHGTVDMGAKADQTIEFPAIPDQDADGTLDLAATASSGLPVSFPNRPGSPVVWQDAATIAFSGPGTVGIIALQAGNDDWNPAPDVTNTFMVVRGAPPRTDFGGEGLSDIAVYCELTGMWYALSLESGLIMWEASLGGLGFIPVPGDYTGDGISDLAVYEGK